MNDDIQNGPVTPEGWERVKAARQAPLILRVPDAIVSDLRWWADDEYEGDMGRRSTMGGITSTLERGALIQSEHGGAAITGRGLYAAGRIRKVERHLVGCTSYQRLILRAAFRTGNVSGGLLTFGPYPLAALACEEVHSLFKARGGNDLARLLGWLRDLAQRSMKGKHAAKAEARDDVELLKVCIERDLVDALRAYGVDMERAERLKLPSTLTHRELGRVMGLDHHTVATRIVSFHVRTYRQRIVVQDLLQKWPDAARALTGS